MPAITQPKLEHANRCCVSTVPVIVRAVRLPVLVVHFTWEAPYVDAAEFAATYTDSCQTEHDDETSHLSPPSLREFDLDVPDLLFLPQEVGSEYV